RFGATAYQLIESKPLLDVAPALRQSWLQRKCASGRVIASTSAININRIVATELASQHWDCVVVDEAHRITSDPRLYQWLHLLSKRSAAFLALSATPSKRE